MWENALRASGLTVSFAPLGRQQFDDTQEALGCSQVQRTVAHLTARIYIRAKLQQQLHQLRETVKQTAFQTERTVSRCLESGTG